MTAAEPRDALSLSQWTEDRLPEDVQAAGRNLLERVAHNPNLIGDSTVVRHIWIETHTLGCRNAADTADEDQVDEHLAIHAEYLNDGVSLVVGDPESGVFLTYTPQTDFTLSDLAPARPAAAPRRRPTP
jgi:hypothetical protein